MTSWRAMSSRGSRRCGGGRSATRVQRPPQLEQHLADDGELIRELSNQPRFERFDQLRMREQGIGLRRRTDGIPNEAEELRVPPLRATLRQIGRNRERCPSQLVCKLSVPWPHASRLTVDACSELACELPYLKVPMIAHGRQHGPDIRTDRHQSTAACSNKSQRPEHRAQSLTAAGQLSTVTASCRRSGPSVDCWPWLLGYGLWALVSGHRRSKQGRHLGRPCPTSQPEAYGFVTVRPVTIASVLWPKRRP